MRDDEERCRFAFGVPTLLKKILLVCLLVATLALTICSPALAADVNRGARIFQGNCSACHLGGGNVVIVNKTLKKDALKKYGKYSLEAIQNQMMRGRNAMPAFGGRLTPSQIEDVAAYVFQQAQTGWK